MSLYLQVAIGAGLYLLDAGHVREIAGQDGAGASLDAAMATVDLRALFAEPAARPAAAVVFAQADAAPAALIVDRIDGLVDVAAASFRPLPPIGPVGGLIDAVAADATGERPRLRLRGERALAAAAIAG